MDSVFEAGGNGVDLTEAARSSSRPLTMRESPSTASALRNLTAPTLTR